MPIQPGVCTYSSRGQFRRCLDYLPIAGDQIPLAGRIMAVADVYYALSIIVSEHGKQFDPEVVDAFVKNEPQFVALREKLGEVTKAAA